MGFLSLMAEIGDDADLLARSDVWLEAERRRAADNLGKAADELRAIQLAQKIKQCLQQKNLVAVQQILRDNNGEVNNIIIRIMTLPDALMILTNHDALDELNTTAQLAGWTNDGYDLPTSAALRPLC